MSKPQILLISLGGDPNPGGKQALKMCRAHIHAFCQLFQRQIITARINQVDGAAQDLLNDPVVGQIYLGGKRVTHA